MPSQHVRRSIATQLLFAALLILLWCGPPLSAAEGKKGREAGAGGLTAEAQRAPAAGAKAGSRAARPAEKPTRPGDSSEKTDFAAAHRKAIFAALRQPTQLDFSKAPLREVIDYVKDFHKIEIQLDRKAMEESGVSTDQRVTVNLKGVTLQSALDLALRPLDLVWTIHDEVLLITTWDACQEYMNVEVYDVADLAACRDEKGEAWDDYKTLIDLITSQIEPTTWDSVGGPGAISGGTLGSAKVLVITNSIEVHTKIEILLARIREVGAHTKGHGKPPMRSRPKPAPQPDPRANAHSPIPSSTK